ncbi:very long chain fatty acid elongase AAEL008004-like [Dermacentor albipictus]|uniref:very long chain fatty acid elongase AAEL008004-like n=1 Tax=Dermacentor albipictus TaxID=60249 RepID=UPI0031FD2244
MSSPVSSAPSPSIVVQLYDYFWSRRDPRTEGWGGIADSRFVLPLLLGYIYFVKVAGPLWMRDRKPFELKWAVLTYNIFTVIANAYFAVRVFQVAYLSGHYNVLCQGIEYHNPSERDLEIMRLVWWYCLVRVADFLDTLFFVLRKKNSQITFLHVSHHAFIVFSGWFYMNFGTDGQPDIGVSVNAFVHVIMYSYYFLAALGSSVQKYLWWKRYLTQLQIVQFIGLKMHLSITLFYDCGYPRSLALFALSQGFFGLLLFINFYVRNYVLRMTRGKEAGAVRKRD